MRRPGGSDCRNHSGQTTACDEHIGTDVTLSGMGLRGVGSDHVRC